MNCRPGKPFPAEDKIGEFLDKSKNGVVFMSFGSVIKASVMPKENKDIILKVFARFPQYDFIWKWEEELPNAPKNVLGMNYHTYRHASFNRVFLYCGILSNAVFSWPKNCAKFPSNTVFSKKI